MLEESTDSDVKIFSSEEDEDGIEPNSDEDGQLDDNSETNEDGGTRTSDSPLQRIGTAFPNAVPMGKLLFLFQYQAVQKCVHCV